MENKERLTHQERSQRRKAIEAEARSLSDQMKKGDLVRHLSEKHNLGEHYVASIINLSHCYEDRAKRRFNIAQDAENLSGTINKSEIISQLATKYEVSPATIQKALNEYNISLAYVPKPRIKKPSSRSHYMERAIFEGIRNGYTVNELSHKLDCSRENVYRYYRRLVRDGKLEAVAGSLLQRKRADMAIKRNEYTPKIIQMHGEGNTIPKIAEAIGLPKHVVSEVLMQNSPLLIDTDNISRSFRYKWLAVIADLFNPDLSVGEIARKHNKHSSNISALIAECRIMKIPIPTYRKDDRKR